MKSEERVVKILAEKKLTITTAESCTGGLVAKRITDVEGSSKVFECGIVCYSNRIKKEFLGVHRKTLENFTAVSVKTAKEMALGILKKVGADIAVAITGYASPVPNLKDEEKTIIIAIADYNGVECTSFEPIFSCDDNARIKNREKAADIAFEMILNKIKD